jgi:hypothetical protein
MVVLGGGRFLMSEVPLLRVFTGLLLFQTNLNSVQTTEGG